MNGYLQIVWVDHDGNRFVTLGGAGWDTMRETRAEFARIPSVPDSDLVLDLIRGDDGVRDGIVDDKCITPETAERLLGASLSELKEAGIRRETGDQT